MIRLPSCRRSWNRKIQWSSSTKSKSSKLISIMTRVRRSWRTKSLSLSKIFWRRTRRLSKLAARWNPEIKNQPKTTARPKSRLNNSKRNSKSISKRTWSWEPTSRAPKKSWPISFLPQVAKVWKIGCRHANTLRTKSPSWRPSLKSWRSRIATRSRRWRVNGRPRSKSLKLTLQLRISRLITSLRLPL